MDTEQQDQLIARLHALAKAVADRDWNEFTMRVPAEIERDADLVLSRAAEEIARLRARVAELEAALKGLSDMYAHTWDCSTGDLLMMASSIPRFEAAHKAACAALGKPPLDDDDPEPPK